MHIVPRLARCHWQNAVGHEVSWALQKNVYYETAPRGGCRPNRVAFYKAQADQRTRSLFNTHRAGPPSAHTGEDSASVSTGWVAYLQHIRESLPLLAQRKPTFCKHREDPASPYTPSQN